LLGQLGKNIKQVTKSETSWLAWNAFISPEKKEEIFCCYPTPSDTTSHSDTDRDVPSADDWTEEE